MTANGQQPVTYGDDAASRLTQVAQGSLTVGLGYDNANRRTSITYPNGTNTSYAYDVASRLTTINHLGPSGVIEALTYQYDPAGNRTSLTRNNAAASLLLAAVASATYDAANEQTAFAGATLTYDANGNLTNDGTNTYVWDARNRLVSISGGATASFQYDALGRRTSKTIGSIASQFLYDGNDIAAEIGGSAVGASYLRSLNIDEPFVRQTGTGNEFYHTDALGSSLALSNAQGASGTIYTYEPFGKTTITGGSSNSAQYIGRESDGTGLVYYRARYYSSTLHRFVVEDPLSFEAGDINLYGYSLNNPATFKDPTGEIVILPFLIACANNMIADAILDRLSGRKFDIMTSALGCVPGLGQASKVLRLAERAINKIPGRPLRGPNAPQEAFDHLKKYHGVNPEVASNRLHRLKEQGGGRTRRQCCYRKDG